MKKDRLITFRVAPDFYSRIRRKAERESINVSALLRVALQDWLVGRYVFRAQTQDKENKSE